jgi:hypothetical protein
VTHRSGDIFFPVTRGFIWAILESPDTEVVPYVIVVPDDTTSNALPSLPTLEEVSLPATFRYTEVEEVNVRGVSNNIVPVVANAVEY